MSLPLGTICVWLWFFFPLPACLKFSLKFIVHQLGVILWLRFTWVKSAVHFWEAALEMGHGPGCHRSGLSRRWHMQVKWSQKVQDCTQPLRHIFGRSHSKAKAGSGPLPCWCRSQEIHLCLAVSPSVSESKTKPGPSPFLVFIVTIQRYFPATADDWTQPFPS